MSLFLALNNGSSGIQAANAGINATSQNVANVMTPGYHRRSAVQGVSDPLASGGLLLGTGVDVHGITRSSSGLLGMQQVTQAGLATRPFANLQLTEPLEVWFDETSASGARVSYSAFIDSLNAATADPGDMALRMEVMAGAQGFASTLASTSQAIADTQQAARESARQSVDSVNTVFDEIAQLNESILAAGGAESAPDLADRRDLLVRSAGETVGATSRTEPDGSVTVLVGGHAAVSGNEARRMSMQDGPPPAVKLSVDGGTVDVTSSVGGATAGQLDAWHQAEGYQADLDAITVAFADAFNAQHAAGYDSYGNPGGALFTYDPANPASSLAVDPAVVGDPGLLAFASDPGAAAGDGGNLTAMIGIEGQALVGGQTLGDALSSLTSRVGGDVATARNNADRESMVLYDLDALAGSLTGVDLDEEAANLIAFQAAYQAAAKVVQVSDELMGTLLEIT